MATVSGKDVKKIVVACEAGMGSSVMVEKMIAKQLKNTEVVVGHAPVNKLAAENPDLVLCHRSLLVRAKEVLPDTVVIPFDMFIGDPRIASAVAAVINGLELSDG